MKELNDNWKLWLISCYQTKPHSGLEYREGSKEHLTPEEAWKRDEKELVLITPEKCRESFLWVDTRKVDKTGCFTLHGEIYDAGAEYVGQRIEIRYDPLNREKVEIWEKDEQKKIVVSLKIEEYNGRKREKEKEILGNTVKSGSRMVRVLKKEEKEKQEKKHQIISFVTIERGGKDVK